MRVQLNTNPQNSLEYVNTNAWMARGIGEPVRIEPPFIDATEAEHTSHIFVDTECAPPYNKDVGSHTRCMYGSPPKRSNKTWSYCPPSPPS